MTLGGAIFILRQEIHVHVFYGVWIWFFQERELKKQKLKDRKRNSKEKRRQDFAGVQLKIDDVSFYFIPFGKSRNELKLVNLTNYVFLPITKTLLLFDITFTKDFPSSL